MKLLFLCRECFFVCVEQRDSSKEKRPTVTGGPLYRNWNFLELLLQNARCQRESNASKNDNLRVKTRGVEESFLKKW
jgi:hypothetical protein